MRYRISGQAGARIDAIYRYTRERWGEAQADRYIAGLFERFSKIAAKEVTWLVIPAEFGVEGYYCRYEQHFIYWRQLADRDVGIVTVLHARMHQIERFREDFRD